MEMLYNANHVQFVPASEANGDVAGVHMLCGPSEAAHGCHTGHFIDGMIFVMNEEGKTVARYNLHKPQPQPAV